MIRIARILLGEFFHKRAHFPRSEIRSPDQYRLPKRESRTLLRLHFKYPRRRMIVRSESVLNAMNWEKKLRKHFLKKEITIKMTSLPNGSLGINTLDARMVDPEAEPISVAIHRS